MEKENQKYKNSLFYIGRALEKIVPVRSRYRKNLIKIPTPEFYTFYNGAEEYPKEKILHLEDAFLTQTEHPMLRLDVKVINVNYGKGHEVLERCPILKEYSRCVEIIREHRLHDKENAMARAVEECIRKGILAEYLRRKGSEVINMLIAEYDYDLDIEVQREEAFEAGYSKGEKSGYSKGEKSGREAKLRELISKKLAKGKSISVIADELEQDEKTIAELIQEHLT